MRPTLDNPTQRADSATVRCVLCLVRPARILRSLLSFLLLPPSPLLGYANLHGKAVTVSEQLTLPFVTGSESPRQVESPNPVVVTESKALPPVLDWLFGPKSNSLSDRILARLIQLEAHEPNLHFKSDYRQAWITTSFATKGVPEPFVRASYSIYGVHPNEVWPHIVAERKAKLGNEYYQWYDSNDILRPNVPKIPPTPAATHAANGAVPVDGPITSRKEAL